MGLLAGLAGFIANCLPLPLLPGIHLIFGSAITVAASVLGGPWVGAVAGLVAGFRTWLLWSQPFPFSALLLCAESAWVGFWWARRARARPLYLSLAYWLLLGGGTNLLGQHFLFGLPWRVSSAIGLRSVVNGFFCALVAEALLIVWARLARRYGGAPRFQLSLSATVGLALMLGVSVPMTAGIVAFTRHTRARMMEDARVGAVGRAHAVGRALAAQMDTFRRAIAQTADAIPSEGIGLGQTERLNRLLGVTRRQNPELAGMYVADAQAHTVAFSPPRNAEGHSLIGLDYSDRRYYQDLARTGETVFSGIYQGRGGMTTPTAAIAIPVRDPAGNVYGFVLGWFHLKVFWDLADHAAQEASGDEVTITDGDGLLVAQSSSASAEYRVVRDLAAEPFVAAALAARQGDHLLATPGRPGLRTAASAALTQRSWLAWSTVPASGWKVLVRSSMRRLDEAVARLYLQTVAALLGLLLAAALGAHLLGRTIARPLVDLEATSQRVAAGDLSARPEGSYILNLEVSSLSQAFTQMASRLEGAWTEQRRLTAEAEDTAHAAQAYARHLSLLNALARELSSTIDLQSICGAARRYMQEQMHPALVLICLAGEAGGSLEQAYAWSGGADADPAALPPSASRTAALARCARTRSPQLSSDAAFCLPLLAAETLMGMLYVEGPAGHRYVAEDLERVQPAASQIAVALGSARLFARVARGKSEWEATFDAMMDGVFLFDVKGRLLRANRSAAAMEGSPVEALVGQRCCEVLRCVGRRPCLVEEMVRSGAAQALELAIPGRRDPVLITVEAVREGGDITGAIVVARDLGDLRRAEEDAREQRQLSTHLLEFAQEAVCTIDGRGRCVWFNPRLCEITGLSPRVLDAMPLAELIHPEDRRHVIRRFYRARAGRAQSFEARFLRGGEVRWARLSCAPIRGDETASGVLAMIRDVTDERLAAERMQQTSKLAAVGQLAAGVAHDFNNLLAVILGRAQLLKRHLDGDRAQAGLTLIEKAALDGAATVRRLQNFSRRRPDEEHVPLSLDDLARDVVEMLRTRWRNDALARGVVYQVELDLDAPTRVLGSAAELREVLTNLLVNALDAMPAGGTVRMLTRLENGLTRLSVVDHGVGMPPEVRKRIFEPFYTTKGHAGTGLGLAVSYAIVQRHQGTIEVESEPGRGTTFSVRLPTTSHAGNTREAEAPPAAPAVRVLVIDDEDAVRQTLMEILRALGHHVSGASGGLEGVALLKEGSFDVVFTDLSMPEMDGWTVARHVRALRPQAKVFLVTGYGATVEPDEEQAGLVRAVIGKPFGLAQVEAALQRISG